MSKNGFLDHTGACVNLVLLTVKFPVRGMKPVQFFYDSDNKMSDVTGDCNETAYLSSRTKCHWIKCHGQNVADNML